MQTVNSLCTLIQIPVSIHDVPLRALIDSGASENFISSDVVSSLQLPFHELKFPSSLRVADGSIHEVTKFVRVKLSFDSVLIPFVLRIFSMSHQVILGFPFLQRFQPLVDWSAKCLSFVFRGRSVTLCSADKSCVRSMGDRHVLLGCLETKLPSLFRQSSIIVREAESMPQRPKKQNCNYSKKDNLNDIHAVVESQLQAENPQELIPFALDEFVLGKSAKAKEKSQEKTILKLTNVPQEGIQLINSFSELFPVELPPGLPPKREIEFHIELVPQAVPPKHRVYRMAPAEEAELKKQLDKFLADGRLEPAQSPYGAGVLFAPKKDGGYRLCVDYRQLNKITIRDTYHLPRPEQLIDSMAGSMVFSKLDLASGYHQLRVVPENVSKTAFNTSLGSFQWRVMPFGVSNAPSTFQRLMNFLFALFLHSHVKIFVDDIIIHSKNVSEHSSHLKSVFEILRKNQLYCKPSKCSFYAPEIEFCGFIISSSGVSTIPEKVQTVKDWPIPQNAHDIKSFLGMIGFYQKFIPRFAALAVPLSNLLRKENEFSWTEVEQSSFDALKQTLANAAALAFPNPNLPYIIHLDASGSALGATLSQESRNHGLKLISCLSRKMNSAELNYPVHEHELLALVHALKKWRHYLLGSQVIAYTDNSALSRFLTCKSLAGRQARWLDLFSEFSLELKHIPGILNPAADALSRLPQDTCYLNPLTSDEQPNSSSQRPRRSSADYEADGFIRRTESRVSERLAIPEQRSQVVLVPDVVESSSSSSRLNPHQAVSADVDTWKVAYNADEELKKLIFDVDGNLLPDISFRNGFYWRAEVILVPETLVHQIIKRYHSHPLSGHFGVSKTFSLIARKYTFSRMRPLIKTFISQCNVCQRTKAEKQAQRGELHPLSVPMQKWTSVSLDWIEGLPLTSSYLDSVLVVMDRASLMVHLIPTSKGTSARDVANLFISNIVRLHGIPRTVHSDRDARLINNFWSELCRILDIDHRPTTAYRPSSNGLVERMNQTIGNLLRNLTYSTSNRFTDWTEKLPLLEISINNSNVLRSKYTPYFLNYGYHPCFFLDSTDVFRPSVSTETTKEFYTRLCSDFSTFQELLRKEKDRMKTSVDPLRRSVEFEPGSYVLLNEAKRALAAGHPLGKLADRFSGPYRILKSIPNDTYLLDMPHSLRHPVYHISFLKPYLPQSELMHVEGAIPCSSDNEDVMLQPQMFRKLCWCFQFLPEIDLFASNLHHQVNAYCSKMPDPYAIACDAFNLNWRNLRCWINPPWTLIPAVLSKIANEQPYALMLVPLWRNAPWFPKFSSLCKQHIILNGPLYVDNSNRLRPPPRWLSCVGLIYF